MIRPSTASIASAKAVTSVRAEQALKELKGDLSIRPIYHQRDERIEAHIFIAFVAYCLQVTLKQRLRSLAPGLSQCPHSTTTAVGSSRLPTSHRHLP